jgi:hypothetical protein
MKKYTIWREGFHVMEGKAGASFVAEIEADSFQEACDKHFQGQDLYDSKRLTEWGCRLFEKEKDARKSFG